MDGRLFIGAWATCRWLHNWGKKITCPNNCWLSIVFHGKMGSHGLLSFPIHGESLRVQSRISLARSGTVSCMQSLCNGCVDPRMCFSEHHCSISQLQSFCPPPALQCSLSSVHPSIAMLPELQTEQPYGLYITFLFLLIYLRLIYYILCVWVYCLQANLCTKYIQERSSRGQRRPRVPWNWRYRWLWATMWDLETKPRPSARATRFFYCWANSLILPLMFWAN